MVVKMLLLIFCYLLFYGKAMANDNIIKVYVPDHMVAQVFSALETVPGLEYKPQIRHDKKKMREDIDLSYYDEEYYNRIQKPEPSLPMPRRQHHPFKKMRYLTEGRLSARRLSRAITHAGYTGNQDICKIYNHNLLQVWNTLTTYIKTENNELPNKMALHNIALIIKAYLEHHESYNNSSDSAEPVKDYEINQISPNVNETLNLIKEMLKDSVDVDTTGKIIDLIVSNVTSPNIEEEECAKSNKENLASYVNVAYKKYLDDSNCRRTISIKVQKSLHNKDKRRQITKETEDYKHKKMDLSQAKQFLRQWQDRLGNCNRSATAQTVFLEKVRLIISKYILGFQCNL